MIKSKIIFIITFIACIITLVFILNFDNDYFLDETSLTDNYPTSSMFAIMIEDDNGDYIEYDDDTFPTNMTFNDELSYCTDINGNYLTSDTLSFSDGYGTVTGSDTAFCFLYFDLYNLLYETILLSENNSSSIDDAITYIKGKGTPDFSTTTNFDDHVHYVDDWGLYYADDDYGESFYFRGDETTNNYIYFAGYLWRIVRVNGDDSVRIMYYDDTIIESKYNDLLGSNALVGYMYGDAYTNNGVSSETTVTLQNYYYYYSSSYTFDDATGTYTLDDDATQQVWNSSLVGYYTCRSTSTSCSTLYEIDSYTDSKSGAAYKYSSTSETDEDDNTVYTQIKSTSTSSYTLATMYYYGTSYEYDSRNGYTLLYYDSYSYDGSTTLNNYYTCATDDIYCSTLYQINSADSSTVANATMYSLTTNNYATTTENKYSSTIKTTIDEWYVKNILNESDGSYSYSEYLTDTLFCNDRSITSGTGIGNKSTTYAGYTRIFEDFSPILTCPQINDAFTVDDTEYGNGDLTYPVALITADELIMSGVAYKLSVYGYTNPLKIYWTMTPYDDDSAFISYFDTLINHTYVTNYSNSTASITIASPVVNLSTSVRVVSGDGSKDNPYEITMY